MKHYEQKNKIIQGASVQVHNGDVNNALKKLKKILDNDERQKDLAKHEFFEKPSVKNKRMRAAARKRQQRLRNEELIKGVYRKPTGTKWMKGKRPRRKVLDDSNAFMQYQRSQKSDKS